MEPKDSCHSIIHCSAPTLHCSWDAETPAVPEESWTFLLALVAVIFNVPAFQKLEWTHSTKLQDTKIENQLTKISVSTR
jgi:hypothetical protein